MDREFIFTERDFKAVQKLVREHTGIALADAKRDMVYSRLSRRLRALKLKTFKEYISLLGTGDEVELGKFVNQITTNLTSFFRENHHFEHLEKELFPALIKKNASSKKIRIWSAGCSTGEEPYSIAMTALKAVPSGWDVSILATDLDTNVLEKASSGIYTEDRIEGLPTSLQRRWFTKGKGDMQGKVTVMPALQDIIEFKQLNLMGDWPVKPGVDILFCRNVVIYFDKETQRTLFDRYANILAPEAHMFIGHSETLYKVTDRFKLLGQTIYQRTS